MDKIIEQSGASERARHREQAGTESIQAVPIYGSMLVSTLVLPGLGHIQANQWRGWVYLSLWAGATGIFAYSLVNYGIAYNNYYNDFSTLDATYVKYNDAMKLRNYAFLPFLGVYVISLIDIMITGNLYVKPTQKSLSFNLGVTPEVVGDQMADPNYNFTIQRKF